MPPRTTSVLLAFLLAAALAVIVTLTGKVRTLRAAVLRERQRALLPRVGQYVPPLMSPSVNGDTIHLTTRGARGHRVMLFHTATCTFCKVEVSAWRELRARLATRGIGDSVLVGVSLDASDSTARSYALANGWTFAVVRLDDLRTRSLFRVLTVPRQWSSIVAVASCTFGPAP